MFVELITLRNVYICMTKTKPGIPGSTLQTPQSYVRPHGIISWPPFAFAPNAPQTSWR